MAFEFETGTGEDFELWEDTGARLLDDLREIAAGKMPESELEEYLQSLCGQLTEAGSTYGTALYLQFTEPDSLTPDDTVDFVYRPTYIAAAILMTAYYRFESFRTPAYAGILCGVLNAAMEREFTGAGYLRIPGLIDTLEIFAEGDTYKFIRKYPDVNPLFAEKLDEAVTILNDKICTGKIRNPWLDDDYVERGLEVRAKIRKKA